VDRAAALFSPWFFFAIFTDHADKFALRFRLYDQEEDNRLCLKQWFVTLDDLQNDVEAITRYCAAFVGLCHRIYADLKLQLVEGPPISNPSTPGQ